jgi:hypothetical protein
MEDLSIKLSPKQKEDQLTMIKTIRTHLMMYTSYLKGGQQELARVRLNTAVVTMDIMREFNKLYAKQETTKTYIIISEEKKEVYEETKRIQFWKKAA